MRTVVWAVTAGLVVVELLLFAVAGHLLVEESSASASRQARILLVVGPLALGVVTLQLIFVAAADLLLLKPLGVLVRGLEIMRTTHAAHELELPDTHFLGPLAEQVHGLGGALHDARRGLKRALLSGAAAEQSRRVRLEQVVRELHEGVVVCDASGRILLYNDAARRDLDAHPALGLGRSVYRILDRAPIEHALGLFAGNEAKVPDTRSAEILCSVKGTEIWLRCRVGPFGSGDESGPLDPGFLLALEDVTRRRRRAAVRDTLLREISSGLRAALESLRPPSMSSGALHGRSISDEGSDGIRAALTLLEDHIETLETEALALSAADRTTSEVYGGDLLRVIAEGLLARRRIRVSGTHASQWLAIDSHNVTRVVEYLGWRAAEFANVRELEISLRDLDGEVGLEIRWEGRTAEFGTIAGWVEEALARVPGEALIAGSFRVLSDPGGQEPARSWMTLLLPASGQGGSVPDPVLPPRPEFYDFDLATQGTDWRERAEQDLCALEYVVFDTETTGLQPSRGDEIVSIAGVRIVNGQIVHGESFEQLVNPGRHIPRSSVRFHGITDERVRNEPPVTEVLKRFREYAGDAVLVAYNSAFDMKFLRMKEASAGVRFDNPVLDVLLLSVCVHEHVGDHTLDAIAGRLGVEVVGRHTAIGDAVVTAEIFLHLLNLLPEQGVRTLGDATRISGKALEIRKQQEAF